MQQSPSIPPTPPHLISEKFCHFWNSCFFSSPQFTTHHFHADLTLVFVFCPVPLHLILFSHQTGKSLLSPAPNPTHPLFPIKSGFDCTMLLKKRKTNKNEKICHFIFQYNQDRLCPAPVCPVGGDVAMR